MHKPLINLGLIVALALTAGLRRLSKVPVCGTTRRRAAGCAWRQSTQGVRAGRGTPLEIVLEQGEWLRVRDQTGLMAWIRKQDVSSLRTLQVIKPATVRREADAKSAAIFRAETGLLLDLLESTKTGWIKVKHRDGDIGFIRIEEVWGL